MKITKNLIRQIIKEEIQEAGQSNKNLQDTTGQIAAAREKASKGQETFLPQHSGPLTLPDKVVDKQPAGHYKTSFVVEGFDVNEAGEYYLRNGFSLDQIFSSGGIYSITIKNNS